MRRMDDITGRCLERSTRESIQIEAVTRESIEMMKEKVLNKKNSYMKL